ncbi:MAG TPA: HAD hydrolase-like protein, partial [Phycisphaerae bacterium]|nr:HAD hydrolase-like protein [Phycisphaerae bacterium]
SVLFVGDSPLLDVAAPAAMGMKTALVDSKPGFWPAKDLVSASPDLHLETVADLPALLEGVC